jgi:hypothetical protein
MRIYDNLGTVKGIEEEAGYIKTPKGEIFEVSRSNRSAKKLSGDEYTLANQKFGGAKFSQGGSIPSKKFSIEIDGSEIVFDSGILSPEPGEFRHIILYNDGETVYQGEIAESDGLRLEASGAIEIGMAKGGKVKKDTYSVVLSSAYNPDDAQRHPQLRSPIIKPFTVEADSIEDAREKVGVFIRDHRVGGGAFPNAKLFKNGEHIGHISYNMRVWDKDGEYKELKYEDGGKVNTNIDEDYNSYCESCKAGFRAGKTDVYGYPLNEWGECSYEKGDNTCFSFPTINGTVMYGKDLDTGKYFAFLTREPHYMEFYNPEKKYNGLKTMEEAKEKGLELLQILISENKFSDGGVTNSIPTDWKLAEDYDGIFVYEDGSKNFAVNIDYNPRLLYPYHISFTQLKGDRIRVGIENGAYTTDAKNLTEAQEKAVKMMQFLSDFMEKEGGVFAEGGVTPSIEFDYAKTKKMFGDRGYVIDYAFQEGTNHWISVDSVRYEGRNPNIRKDVEEIAKEIGADDFGFNTNRDTLFYFDFPETFAKGGVITHQPWDEEKFSSIRDYQEKIISQHFGRENRYTGSADWGGLPVWTVKGGLYEGTFIVIDDTDDVVLLTRKFNEDTDEYEDETILQTSSSSPMDYDPSELFALISEAERIRGKFAEGGIIPYSIDKTKHTKTGQDIYVVRMTGNRMSKDEYKEVARKVEKEGGYWSRYVSGFVFNTEPSPEKLKEIFGGDAGAITETPITTIGSGKLINTLHTGGRAPRKDHIASELRSGKMEYAEHKTFNPMVDSYDFTPWDKLKWKDAKSDDYIFKQLSSKDDYNRVYVKDGRDEGDGIYLSFGDYYIRYKDESPEALGLPPKHIEAGQFWLSNSDNSGELMKRLGKWIISVEHDHWVSLRECGEEMNGKWNCSDPHNENIRTLRKELKHYHLAKNPMEPTQAKPEEMGTFAGLVDQETMAKAWRPNTPIEEVFKKAGKEYPKQVLDFITDADQSMWRSGYKDIYPSNWNAMVDEAMPSLKQMKETLLEIQNELKVKYPQFAWDVTAQMYPYGVIKLGYELTFKPIDSLAKRLIALYIVYDTRKKHDFSNNLEITGKINNPYLVNIYYYPETGEDKEKNHNPTISESQDNPYSIGQLKNMLSDMDNRLTYLKEVPRTSNPTKIKPITQSETVEIIEPNTDAEFDQAQKLQFLKKELTNAEKLLRNPNFTGVGVKEKINDLKEQIEAIEKQDDWIDKDKVISTYETFLGGDGRELFKLVRQTIFSESALKKAKSAAWAKTATQFDLGRYDYKQEVFVHPAGARTPYDEKYKVEIKGGPVYEKPTISEIASASPNIIIAKPEPIAWKKEEDPTEIVFSENQWSILNEILPKHQLWVVKGKKPQSIKVDFADSLERQIELYKVLPEYNSQDKKGKEAVAYLHYFYGGSDWYVTEKDTHPYCYGFAILNGDMMNAEFGSMSFDEFIRNGKVELDFHWEPNTINEALGKKSTGFEKREEVELAENISKKLEGSTVKVTPTHTEVSTSPIILDPKAYKNAFEVNKAIEKLVDELEATGTMPGPEEKAFMEYYSGYGGLGKYMDIDEDNPKTVREAKKIKYQYFTNDVIVRKMWNLAYKHGYRGGPVIEPSVGIGAFLKYAPQNTDIVAVEIEKYPAKICKYLHPNATVLQQGFEQFFINNRNKSVRGDLKKVEFAGHFDLNIGNPPYGEFSGTFSGMGEGDYTHAQNYIDYFIFRGLDLLKPGGLLIFIVGSTTKPWLETGNSTTKTLIAEKADLVDGYRLPDNMFERTSVTTEIVVLRKKGGTIKFEEGGVTGSNFRYPSLDQQQDGMVINESRVGEQLRFLPTSAHVQIPVTSRTKLLDECKPTKAGELGIYYQPSEFSKRKIKIEDGQDVYEFLKEVWDPNTLSLQEQFCVVLLNRNNVIISYEFLFKGGVSSTIVDAKIVASLALKTLATGVILAHNHPSGQIRPSDADNALTRIIGQGLRILDIQLLDHVIITQDGYYSYASSGNLNY